MTLVNDHLPNASTEFIIDKIIQSGKVIPESQLKIGSTITLMLKENKALHKRIITIRDFNGEVNFLQATNHAISFRFMGDLLDWFRENKGWNEGGESLRFK
jgi:hypothetical protein